ncbi:uncharacterized protein LOC111320519 [Stylophora pistillata]|uniref:uncharacterized protein LOC111320519 n=1 Tax=Stylophora pistillata TaxID=50429 RepID=UPI000C04BA5C|nr:uncharacterized protein LOC111320519 [Stylophora pistillata]
MGTGKRINDAPVCFGAKNDGYGSFNVTKSGQLKTMKLLHRSGQIKCNSHTAVSYWGCTHQRYADKKLMTFITNDKRETMFPPGHGLEAFRKGDPHIICLDIKHFYTLEGANHTSPELVFPDPSSPVSVSRDQELQIWYGQDWKGCGEKDNSGEVCVDVYAWYL